MSLNLPYNARVIETYAEARDAVDRELAPLWGDTRGTFYVAPEGYEDDTSFFVPWGAREWLVDGDPSFVLLNGAATFVDKVTGFVSMTLYVEEAARIDRMSPVTA